MIKSYSRKGDTMEYLKIGQIVNTRGIKGELKIKSFTDFQTDRYQSGSKVYVFYEGEYLEFTVKKYYSFKNQDILVFKNHEDINLVEKYKGSDIYTLADNETTLYEDEFHISEIIDLDVYQNEKLVGKVIDVKEYPQGDYLVIETKDSQNKLVPFHDEFIINIDLDENRIEIVEMEGLL